LFGAKPAQSETPARAAAKRRPTRKRAKCEKDGGAFLLRLRMAVMDGKSACSRHSHNSQRCARCIFD
jgi:hypothetical protein